MTEALPETILRMVTERGGAKTVCPSEVARAVAGSDEKEWRLLMKPIRAQAVRLALEGRLTIRRKGRAVDPRDFKGIYRLGLPEAEGDRAGPGRSSGMRPDRR